MAQGGKAIRAVLPAVALAVLVGLSGCLTSPSSFTFQLAFSPGDEFLSTHSRADLIVSDTVLGRSTALSSVGDLVDSVAILREFNGTLLGDAIDEQAIEFIDVATGQTVWTVYGCNAQFVCSAGAYAVWPSNPLAGNLFGTSLLSGMTLSDGLPIRIENPVIGQTVLLAIEVTERTVTVRPEGRFHSSIQGCSLLTGTVTINRNSGLPTHCGTEEGTWMLSRLNEGGGEAMPIEGIARESMDVRPHGSIVMAAVDHYLPAGSDDITSGSLSLRAAAEALYEQPDFKEFEASAPHLFLSSASAGTPSKDCQDDVGLICAENESWEIAFRVPNGSEIEWSVVRTHDTLTNTSSFAFTARKSGEETFERPPTMATASIPSVIELFRSLTGADPDYVSLVSRTIADQPIRIAAVGALDCEPEASGCSSQGSELILVDMDHGRPFQWMDAGQPLEEILNA